MDIVSALGPDACRSDRNAPCRYWHTKVAALNGQRGTLTDEELEFVGVAPRRRNRSAWHAPRTTVPYDEASDPGERRLDFLA